MKLEGLKAIVTGGASGIGAATAKLLSQRSGRVAIWDLNEEAGRQVADEIGGIYLKTDVSDLASVQQSLASTLTEFNRVDFLFNSAGIFNIHPIIGESFEDLARGLESNMKVNVTGTYNVTVAVAQHMVSQDLVEDERGVIINVSSIAAEQGNNFTAAYSASKGAIAGLTMPLARELGSYKIRVNSIMPYIVQTPMLANIPQKDIEFLESQSTVGRLSTAEDIALLVTQILEHPYISATNLTLYAGGVIPKPI